MIRPGDVLYSLKAGFTRLQEGRTATDDLSSTSGGSRPNNRFQSLTTGRDIAAPAFVQATASAAHGTGIPDKIGKEWVSRHCLQAMAAQAGLNLQTPEWDDGVDLQIGSTKPAVPSVTARNVWFSVQLKATQNWEIQSEGIAFFVDRQTHEHLRLPSVSPQYLILYTMPISRLRWITYHDNHSRFSHRFFYVSLANEPPIGTSKRGVLRAGKTIYVPASQIVTAGTLLRLYKDAAARPSMGAVVAASAAPSGLPAKTPRASRRGTNKRAEGSNE